MDPLHQRLKELDPDTFHKLCFHLLMERHPGTNLHQVEGASGDEGLDIFEGELDGQPTIWQCKSFPNGVGESQKGQIRESFNTALRNFTPKNWILCLSVNLDSKTHRWWQRFKTSKSPDVTVGEMFASQIVHELLHRTTVRNHFFPNAVLDPIELKRLIARTGELTTEELGAITQNNVEDYIARLKERDARFNYELVFSNDLEPQPDANRPGLMMSMRDGAKVLNVFARDVEALRQNPPIINVTLSGTGVDKFNTLVKTGIPQTFEDSEFEHTGSNTPLFDMSNMKGQKLIVGPTQSMLPHIKAQITIEKAEDKVEYSLIELAQVRAGTDEVELKSVSKALPFELRLTLANNPLRGSLNYVSKFTHFEIRQIAKFAHAITLIYSGATVRVWDLERESLLFTFNTNERSMTPEQIEFYELVAGLKRIADTFNLPHLKWPKDVSESDLETIDFLTKLIRGIDQNKRSLMCTITKTADVQDLSRVMALRFVQAAYEPKPILFGHPIDTGPVRQTMNEAEISDYEVTASTFKNAQIGESVNFKFILNSPIRLELDTAE